MSLKRFRSKLSMQILIAVCAMLFAGVSASAVVFNFVLIFPQFVVGGGYISIITLVNTSSTLTVTGTLAFYNQDGTPRSVAIDGQPTGTTLSGIVIPPGGTVVLSTTPGGSQTVAGMVKFMSDNRAGGVVRFVFAGGQVGVLSAAPIVSGALVLNTSGGNDTGVAITNPGTDPINVSLTYADQTGTAIETVNPAYLNPLPPNGQIAKFSSQFGFTQVANKNQGTIQIKVNGNGMFSAFALLLKDGALSSTAVVAGQRTGFAPSFNGTYSGNWHNTTFGSTGTMTMQGTVNTATQAVVINLTINGGVFGGAGGSASLAGAYSLGKFTATGTSALFGPATMTVNADGSFTFTASSVPANPAGVTAFTMTGTAHAATVTGNYTVTFPSGTAGGTVSLTQSTIAMSN